MGDGTRTDVTLEAVVVAVSDDRPRVLVVPERNRPRLPSGALEPDGDPTLDRAMQRIIDEQTGLEATYLEQLYTFGDRDRAPGAAERRLAVGYLVLTREAATSARWHDLYDLFPWEDRRDIDPTAVSDATAAWAGDDPERRRRVAIAFGRGGSPWDGIRALDRYELLYEARLVGEWHVDHDLVPSGAGPPTGTAMVADHRRIVATALSRLRGKLTYRPVVFDLVDDRFTLATLQRTVEAIAGQDLHTQNFRRMVDRTGLVEGTGQQVTTGGRPAELFRFRPAVLAERPRVGLLG